MEANSVPQPDRDPCSMCVLIIGSDSFRASLTMACKQAGWEVSADPGRANAILLDPRLIRWANEPAERIVALVMRARQFARANRLSPRQSWLVELGALGLVGKDMAAQMQISLNTVKYHIRAVLRKTRAHSMSQLVRLLGV